MRTITAAQRDQLLDAQRRVQDLDRQQQDIADEVSAAIGVAPTDDHLFECLFNEGDVDDAIERMGFMVLVAVDGDAETAAASPDDWRSTECGVCGAHAGHPCSLECPADDCNCPTHEGAKG